MKRLLSTIIICFISLSSFAQYYFPPKTGDTWETMSPDQLGWCQDSINNLYTFLDSGKSKGFIVLKDGKIVLEKYFNGHTKDSSWYWASAGKTMVSFLIGRAQEQNFLKITDTTSKYLGTGWTSMTPAQEANINIRHQLTMTSGLDYTQPDCSTPNCLKYWKDPGTDWYYHNPPYTLLRDVLESATGKNINSYMQTEVSLKTGITGLWLKIEPNNLLFSTTRSMARFGSLMINNGVWDGNVILGDTNYLKASVNTSQQINKGYGYLWWLNGKESYRLPQSLYTFPGKTVPAAPDDMYAGIGKNGQYVCVIPSQNMVVIRMGDDPDDSPVPTTFINAVFAKLSNMSCANSVKPSIAPENVNLTVYPNPISIESSNTAQLNSTVEQDVTFYTLEGKKVLSAQLKIGINILDLSVLTPGLYIVKGKTASIKLLVE